MSAIPTILKGDDSGTITLTLDDEHTYDGATLVVAYQGKTKTFSNLTAGGSVGLVFSHDETADFALGCFPLLAQLVGAAGAVETISNAEWRLKTTDIVSEVNAAGSFAVTPGAAFVPIEDVGAVGETYSLKSLKAKLDEVIRVLAQRTATTCVAALLALPLFGGGVETATLEDLPNTATVVTNVDLTASNSNLVQTIRGEITQAGGVTEAITNGLASIEYVDASTPGDYANVSNKAVNAYTVATNAHTVATNAYTVATNGYQIATNAHTVATNATQKAATAKLEADKANAALLSYSLPMGVVAGDGIEVNAQNSPTTISTGGYTVAQGYKMVVGLSSGTQTAINQIADKADGGTVTNIVRDLSLGGIWDEELQVWWTPRMRNGNLTYEATTNVNLNAEN